MSDIIFLRKKYKPLSINYISSSKIQLIGFLGTIDLSFSKKINFIKKNANSFSFFVKNYISFFKLFLIYFLGISSGWFLKMEISGRGFFVYMQKGIGFFNLGFSHGVSYVFLSKADALVYEKKKRLKFILHGKSLFYLYSIAKALKNLRPLNVYKGKGVKFENEYIKLKQGKQGNF